MLAIVLAACGSSERLARAAADRSTSTTTKAAAPAPRAARSSSAPSRSGLRRLDRPAAPARPGALGMMEYQTMPRSFDYEKEDGAWQNVPSIRRWPRMPTVATVNGKQTVTYNISPTRRLVRRPADHLRGLQVHVASRSPPARTSTTRPATTRSRASTRATRRSRSSRSRRRTASWTEPLRRCRLRHPAVAHPRGQEPRPS